MHIGRLLQAADPDYLKSAGIAEKFMAGVNRLLSMQTAEGGFAYWPGQTRNTYWGTAYATHVLLEGIDQGYPIPKDRVDDAIEFLQTTLTNNPTAVDPKYGYSVAKSEPYMQYVLARAGKARKGRIRALIKSPPSSWEELHDENLFLLKTALYLAGDRTYEDELKDAPDSAIGDKRVNGWSYWSALRTRGIQLNLLEDMFPGSVAAEPLARRITDKLRSQGRSSHFNTQELSWTVSGLGKRAAGEVSFDAVKLLADGKRVVPVPKKEGDNSGDQTWQMSGASAYEELFVDVDGLDGNLFAMVSVEGVKPGASYDLGDHTLAVQRRYLRPDGSEIHDAQVDLGELVFVELTLTNQSRDLVRNVVLLDRFPAGLEIENPRLGRGRASGVVDGDLWELDYMDLRDDRIAVFGQLKGYATVHVYYTLRATTAGSFDTPPVEAQAMYEPRQWSRKIGRRFTVIDPWDAM